MKTKCELLLAVFVERPNEFIDLPYLAAVVGSFDIRTRVARLRERGFDIENMIQYDGHQRNSFYRLNAPYNVVEPGPKKLPFNGIAVRPDGVDLGRRDGTVVVNISRHGAEVFEVNG